MTYGDSYAKTRQNLHKYAKLFFAIILGIFLVELFLVFFPDWTKRWDETDLKDRILVGIFLVMKLIVKVLLLGFIIFFSFKSLKMYSNVKEFSALQTSTCIDPLAKTMFQDYGTFLNSQNNYDKSSITFSFIDIIIVCFQFAIEVPLMLLGMQKHYALLS